jgi:hypothetical protein
VQSISRASIPIQGAAAFLNTMKMAIEHSIIGWDLMTNDTQNSHKLLTKDGVIFVHH